MGKISKKSTNEFCPQTLFIYGTYKEDKTPDFGLFCWFSYCWSSELEVMMCIGEDKLTRDRIRAEKIFSANLVTEKLLPMADYFGNKSGYDEDKMDIDVDISKGEVLDVPVLTDSPVSFELEVRDSMLIGEGEVFLCRIRNILYDEELGDDSRTVEERLRAIAPVSTTCSTYFSYDGRSMGAWGEPQKQFVKKRQ